jgi:hypothetical protein
MKSLLAPPPPFSPLNPWLAAGGPATVSHTPCGTAQRKYGVFLSFFKCQIYAKSTAKCTLNLCQTYAKRIWRQSGVCLPFSCHKIDQIYGINTTYLRQSVQVASEKGIRTGDQPLLP